MVYADQKNIFQSKKCFEKTIAINPKYAYAYYALGMANETENNKELAISNYEKFLEYNTDSSAQKAVETRLNNLKK